MVIRAIVCALLFGLTVSCAVGEAAADPQRPNILFAIADDASYPYLSAYGCQWVKTPAFDRIARDGLLFTRAYTSNAKCAPSRSSILTGRYSWQLEEAANHWCYFPPKFKVVTEVLAEHGYQVGMTGKGWGPGISMDAENRPRNLIGKPYQARKLQPPGGGISAIDYAGNFEAFLDEAQQRPWFFWYGGLEPHREYEYGIGITRGGKKLTDIDRVPDYWPDNETVRTDMLDYAYELEYFDRQLQRMLQLLDERGQLQNTLVIVTADNGMPFPRVKGQHYEHSHHLPLAIMWPAGIQNPGRTIEDYVSFVDFAPTLIELLGLEWSEIGMNSTAGRSLGDIFQSQNAGIVNPARDHVLVGKERHDVGRPHDRGYPIRGIIKNNMLLLHNYEPERWPAGNPETGYLNCDGSPTKTSILASRHDPQQKHLWEWSFGKRPAEELYDLTQDPLCLHNLIAEQRFEPTARALRLQMNDELQAQQDPRMFGRGEIFESYPYADEKARHFYERFLRGEDVRAPWVNPTDFDPSFRPNSSP